MTLAPPRGCTMTPNDDGVHVWMLIDSVNSITLAQVLYVFACQFCLTSISRTSEQLNDGPNEVEVIVSAN